MKLSSPTEKSLFATKQTNKRDFTICYYLQYLQYYLATPNLKKILVKQWDIIQQQPKPGLLIGRRKKSNFAGFLGTNKRKNQLILQEFYINFRINFAEKQSVKMADFVLIFRANFTSNQLVLH